MLYNPRTVAHKRSAARVFVWRFHIELGFSIWSRTTHPLSRALYLDFARYRHQRILAYFAMTDCIRATEKWVIMLVWLVRTRDNSISHDKDNIESPLIT